MNRKPSKTAKTIYLKPRTLAALTRTAKRNRRSAAGQGELYIEDGLRRERNTEEEAN